VGDCSAPQLDTVARDLAAHTVVIELEALNADQKNLVASSS